MTVFHLNTKNTSYIFRVLETGQLEQLHYGRRLSEMDDYSPLFKKVATPEGCGVLYDEDHLVCLDRVCLEYSGVGKGDFRESACQVVLADGSVTTDFKYKEHRYLEEDPSLNGLPSVHGTHQTLEVDLVDEIAKLRLTLRYSVFEDCDVLVKSVRLCNEGESDVKIRRLMSSQLDLPTSDYELITFDGCWVREMQKHTKKLQPGIYVNDAKGGTSSNRHNPFVMIKHPATTENHGECLAMNLIYSGNHSEILEVSPFNQLRLLTGINPYSFEWKLEAGECFETPQAVLGYSGSGMNALSQQMHVFVREHVVPNRFKDAIRPVLLNNWEATYFDFTESKLLSLARDAANLGVELFVLDDGWFGARNNDASSLGDWQVNMKKLPNGLSGLANKVNQLGMQFGLWIEPEMVNEDSQIFKNHPHWVMKHPVRSQSLGRHQYVLDLSQEAVVDYLVQTFDEILSSANITYVKWDMNRNFSDVYSTALGGDRQGEVSHRYVLGLYSVIKQLTSKHPNVLFEGCASGGNRFDLGMLCYMPQIWGSDNTDAHERVSIQKGYSYGYPSSCIGAHVSDCPNHQTLRQTPLETRFNVAAFGDLGYELNVSHLDRLNKKMIKDQISFYKEHRDVLQFGTFYRLETRDHISSWMVVTPDQKKAILFYYQALTQPHPVDDIIKTVGLNDGFKYRVESRVQKLNIKVFGDLVNQVTPVTIKNEGLLQHVVSKVMDQEVEKTSFVSNGDLLNYAGFKAYEQFSGTGYNDEVRLMGDFGSRMYVMSAIE